MKRLISLADSGQASSGALPLTSHRRSSNWEERHADRPYEIRRPDGSLLDPYKEAEEAASELEAASAKPSPPQSIAQQLGHYLANIEGRARTHVSVWGDFITSPSDVGERPEGPREAILGPSSWSSNETGVLVAAQRALRAQSIGLGTAEIQAQFGRLKAALSRPAGPFGSGRGGYEAEIKIVSIPIAERRSTVRPMSIETAQSLARQAEHRKGNLDASEQLNRAGWNALTKLRAHEGDLAHNKGVESALAAKHLARVGPNGTRAPALYAVQVSATRLYDPDLY